MAKIAALSPTGLVGTFYVRTVWDSDNAPDIIQPHYDEEAPDTVEPGWFREGGVYRPARASDQFLGAPDPLAAAVEKAQTRKRRLEVELLRGMTADFDLEQMLTWHAKVMQAYLVLKLEAAATGQTAEAVATRYRDAAKGYAESVGGAEGLKTGFDAQVDAIVSSGAPDAIEQIDAVATSTEETARAYAQSRKAQRG